MMPLLWPRWYRGSTLLADTSTRTANPKIAGATSATLSLTYSSKQTSAITFSCVATAANGSKTTSKLFSVTVA